MSVNEIENPVECSEVDNERLHDVITGGVNMAYQLVFAEPDQARSVVEVRDDLLEPYQYAGFDFTKKELYDRVHKKLADVAKRDLIVKRNGSEFAGAEDADVLASGASHLAALCLDRSIAPLSLASARGKRDSRGYTPPMTRTEMIRAITSRSNGEVFRSHDIADELEISETVVKTHLTALVQSKAIGEVIGQIIRYPVYEVARKPDVAEPNLPYKVHGGFRQLVADLPEILTTNPALAGGDQPTANQVADFLRDEKIIGAYTTDTDERSNNLFVQRVLEVLAEAGEIIETIPARYGVEAYEVHDHRLLEKYLRIIDRHLAGSTIAIVDGLGIRGKLMQNSRAMGRLIAADNATGLSDQRRNHALSFGDLYPHILSARNGISTGSLAEIVGRNADNVRKALNKFAEDGLISRSKTSREVVWTV